MTATEPSQRDSASRWREELAAWAIPPEILAGAEESPWTLPPEMFRVRDDAASDGPARQRALEALPDDGSVLDVGCGGGAASLALVPPAGLVVGVDQSEGMLREFTAAAAVRGVDAQAVQGRWPDVESQTPVADVVVCHHVLYNVPDLPAFARALHRHARHRVVVQLGASHPMSRLAPLWRHFHGLTRPDGPTSDLARDVLAEAGFPVRAERSTRPRSDVPRDLRLRVTRARLCLPAEREPEVAAFLDRLEETPREDVTLWWDV